MESVDLNGCHINRAGDFQHQRSPEYGYVSAIVRDLRSSGRCGVQSHGLQGFTAWAAVCIHSLDIKIIMPFSKGLKIVVFLLFLLSKFEIFLSI